MNRGARRGHGGGNRTAGAASFRIIAGRWRSRRLAFPPRPGVRPTGDRIRETLFNWLQPVIPGARCLDLFAGSGALGLEALSRGAAEAVFVDRDPACIEAIGRHLQTLGAEGAERVTADAAAWLRGPARAFDVVFLDPPFDSGLLVECCELLAAGGWVTPGGRIYLEHAAATPPPALPAGWRLLRSARAGAVRYHLAATDTGESERP